MSDVERMSSYQDGTRKEILEAGMKCKRMRHARINQSCDIIKSKKNSKVIRGRNGRHGSATILKINYITIN